MKLLKKIFLASGIAVLAGCNGEFGNRKYDVKEFSIIDTLRFDTFEEIPTTDQLCNFLAFDYPVVLNKYIKYELSKEEINFETFNNFFAPYGLLHISRKEFSAFELIGRSIFKRGKNFVYEPINNSSVINAKKIERECLVDKFYYLDKNFKIDEFSIKGISFKSENPFFAMDREYSRKAAQDKKFLDKEQEQADKYLEKILKHKKSLKD